MAQCPNCKQKLRLWNVGQNCPHCGVNMRFADFDRQFYHDAKEAELSAAREHVFIRTIKASFIGTRLSVVRLVLVLLPAAALLLPVASGSIALPFLHTGSYTKLSVGLLGLIGLLTNQGLSYLLPLLDAPVNGAAVTALVVSVAALALAALFAVLQALSTILSFIHIKRAAKANCAFSCAGIAAVIVSLVFAAVCAKRATFADSMISLSVSFGWAVQIAAFIASFAANLLIVKNGLPVELDEGMAERVEIGRKIKRGELRLDDLPQPIVETAATRKILEEIEKAQSEYDRKQQKKEDGDQ